MPSIDGREALQNLVDAGDKARWPGRETSRYTGTTLRPEISPSFALPPGARVFTIGSCFARNIEEHLVRAGYTIPTLTFSAPAHEWVGRANGLLNEYNAGTICQRIERAFTGTLQPDETIVETEDGWVDLLLPTNIAVTRDRARARRREIDDVYTALPQADVVIVTLGLVEAWFDTLTGCYLNRMPPTRLLTPGCRYRLEVMDVYEAWPLLEKAFGMLTGHGQQVIVTVSPVPFAASFTGRDAITANGYSKAVLRVCAERLSWMPGVDYLPSYETVTWGGLASYHDDNIHVLDTVVGPIVDGMLQVYAAAPAIA